MDLLVQILWRLDYPLTVLVSFLVFFIPLKKRKHFYIPLIIGIIALFGFWQIREIPGIDKDNEWISLLFYLGAITILYFISLLTLEVDYKSASFIILCALTLQHLSFKIALQTINFIDINLYHSAYYFLFSYPILIALCFVIYFLFSRRLKEYIHFVNIYFNVVAFTLFVLIAIIFSIFEQKVMFIDSPDRLLISSLLNFSNITITVLIVTSLYFTSVIQKRKEETLLLSMMAQKQRERFELAKITIDEINIKYHDLKHMLQDNQNKINEEDLKEIRKTITNYKAIVQTSNVGINTAVYESQLKCVNLGIDLNVLLDGGDMLKDYKPHHIYSLLSNLLDNAIEAVSKLDEDKKRIYLTIKKVRESTVIIIENYTENNPVMDDGLPTTSKKDHTRHGYGLKSVKRIVDIYNGLLNISTKDNKFIVKIVFPNA